jgi:hypothetical protein
VTEIHAAKSPGKAVLLARSVEHEPESDIVRHVADVFRSLAGFYRPEVVRLFLDSFVPEELGTPEEPLRLDQTVAFLVARRATADTTYGRRGFDALTYEADRLTPDEIRSGCTEAIATARNEGSGRTGLARVDASVGAARLPDELADRRSIVAFNEDAVPRLVDVVDGWIAGPSADGVLPAPLTILVVRDAWLLTLAVQVVMDVFWPVGRPPVPGLQRGLDELVRSGWVEDRRDG